LHSPLLHKHPEDNDDFTTWVKTVRKPILAKLADWCAQWRAGQIATLFACAGVTVLFVAGCIAAYQAPLPLWGKLAALGLGLLIAAIPLAIYEVGP
jgi:hypothetical protein